MHHPRSPAATFPPPPSRSARRLPRRPHRARDVSRPISPSTPLFARIASPPTSRPVSLTSSRSRTGSPVPAMSPSPLGRPFSAWHTCGGHRCRHRWPLLRGRHRLVRRLDRASREADGPYRRLRRRGVYKEGLMLSVATTADPMPEVDARKASNVPQRKRRAEMPKGTVELMSSKKRLSLRSSLYSHPPWRLLQDPPRVSRSAMRER